MSYKDQIDTSRLPQHIAIIMDGNGRWAKKQGKNRVFGHTEGVKSVRRITEACAKLGVPYLTLYAFSTENWGRPPAEVTALMELLVHSLRKEIKSLNDQNIRLNTIGDMNALPPKCVRELNDGMNLTQNNQRLTLSLALSYSSRWEITNAVKQIAEEVKQGKIEPAQINEQLISGYLSTHNLPDPELLIRTSGEQRISNYLLWQIAYTELYFTEKYWPEFNEEELYKAIVEYQNRDRRFGKL
ncbi:MAG: isoprenyl transferase [Chitinophagales bacterium]|nr:isoprenyl transferase [Chitinophagales bacterium]MBP7533856.1 isoprenyl transferase [Chitinophagales bacterium]